MASCISELMEWDCPDMSVCGNDCTLDDGNPVRMIEDSEFNPFRPISYLTIIHMSRGA